MSPRRRNRRLAPAIALAALGHLLAMFALGWRVPRFAAPESAEDHGPAIEVTLVRPRASPRVTRAPAASPKVLVAPTPGAPILSAPQRPPATPAPPQAEANLDNPRLRDALRGGLGCSDPAAYHLSREERAVCDRRLAGAKPAAIAPRFSAEELAQFDAENRYDPILVRKPHNDCLPRVADHPPPTTNASTPPRASRSGASTAFGLSCAWSF